ncbi:hypothetical protein VTK26DRAFT_5857 [Humicola hyalothermophila]
MPSIAIPLLAGALAVANAQEAAPISHLSGPPAPSPYTSAPSPGPEQQPYESNKEPANVCREVSEQVLPYLPPHPKYPDYLQALGEKLGWESDNCITVTWSKNEYVDGQQTRLFMAWRDGWISALSANLRSLLHACKNDHSVLAQVLGDPCYSALAEGIKAEYQVALTKCPSHGCKEDSGCHNNDGCSNDSGKESHCLSTRPCKPEPCKLEPCKPQKCKVRCDGDDGYGDDGYGSSESDDDSDDSDDEHDSYGNNGSGRYRYGGNDKNKVGGYGYNTNNDKNGGHKDHDGNKNNKKGNGRKDHDGHKDHDGYKENNSGYGGYGGYSGAKSNDAYRSSDKYTSDCTSRCQVTKPCKSGDHDCFEKPHLDTGCLSKCKNRSKDSGWTSGSDCKDKGNDCKSGHGSCHNDGKSGYASNKCNFTSTYGRGGYSTGKSYSDWPAPTGGLMLDTALVVTGAGMKGTANAVGAGMFAFLLLVLLA